MTDADVVAIVLAGGASSRFGSDKLAASYRGRPVLHHALAAAADVADAVVLVLSPEGPTPALPAEVAERVMIVRDRLAHGGPLAGLGTALDALAGRGRQPPFAIVVGGDMPSLAAAVLRLLVEGLAGSPELDAMTLGASPEAEAPARVNSAPAPFAPIPLPMAIRPALARDTVRASLAGGRRSLRAWLATVAGGEIASSAWRAIDPTADTLADIDTREDLRRRE